jgi:N-ethylmaleimide reductase
LIVSEGAPISVQGRGWAFTPGIHTPEQMAGWRGVTDAVHAKGGVIFAQIWHVGRASHVSLQNDGQAPVSSTSPAIPPICRRANPVH